MSKIIQSIKKSHINRIEKRYAKVFKTSKVSFKSVFDSSTKLGGRNYIGRETNICGSDIGECTNIGTNCYLPNCKIGKYSSIGFNVRVQPFTHPINLASTSSTFFKTKNNFPCGKGTYDFQEELVLNNGKYIDIGNDVWIGESVIIKGGIKIGDGAIIGMGAVVTKDVPPYAVVGGVPAKIIKYRFEENIICKLLELKWWDKDYDFINAHRDEFIDVNKLINLLEK